MRVCIFIDGENLRHTICHLFDNRRNPQNAPLFDEQEYLPRQAKWGDFFGYLAEKSKIPEVHAHFSRAYWYVVNAVDAKPWLPKLEWDPAIQKRRFIESDLSDWHQRNQKGIRNLVDFFNKRAIGNQAKMSAEFDGVEKVVAELQRRKTRHRKSIRRICRNPKRNRARARSNRIPPLGRHRLRFVHVAA